MGSLRNPVGPLPSSIYWRRRAVLLSMLALLALLITWVVVSAGGNGKGSDNGANGKNPAPSTITPGPSGSGPAISQAPGGRDETGDGGSEGAGDGSGDSGGSSGSDGEGGDSDPADSAGAGGADGPGGGGSAGGGSEGGTSAGVGAGDALPAGTGSGLPNCSANAVRFSLRSERNTYGPGETPTFLLTARNTSGADCKIDLGPERTVLTVSQATDDDTFWASDDCPEEARSLVFRVPAGDSITYTVKWDRKPSAASCATPKAGAAKPGTYLVEAKAPGFEKVRTSFVLKAD
ncbi:hypothetical protein AB0D90_09330 [Streptomyces althioticus]|uniref:DUF4232 domain-containing protein n=1 Tax=Streptomyces griseorubens TaxID=66897 RepID=A0ABR4T016_9ACTN|nr:hypothetical protein [Streptomyces griseorubens]KEG40808.1 hypothetical protein DJ64_07135 [Streptomyces griseorubens]